MIQRIAAISIALSASLGVLAGCGGSAPEVAYQTKTVDLANGKTDRVPGLALDAKQRLVWSPTVKRKELESESIDKTTGALVYTYTPRERQVICAEPSPDAVSAFALEAAAKASIDIPKTVGISGEFSRKQAETVLLLARRSQTVTLLRDVLYRACESHVNGLIDDFGYSLILASLPRLMMQMMAIDSLGEGNAVVSETDQSKLSAVASKEAALEGQRRKVADIEARIDAANRTVQESHARADGAAAAVNIQQRIIDEADAIINNKANANPPPSAQEVTAARQRKLEAQNAMIAPASQKAAADSAVSQHAKIAGDLATALAAERTALQAAQTERDTAAAQADQVQRRLKDTAGQSVLNVIKADKEDQTLAAACVLWLARNLSVTDKALTSEPLFVSTCRALIGRLAASPVAREGAFSFGMQELSKRILQAPTDNDEARAKQETKQLYGPPASKQ